VVDTQTPGADIRAVGGTSRELQSALDRAGMQTVYALDLAATETPIGDEAGRAGGGPANQILLEVPQPSAGFEQAILSVDANGITTWAFAEEAARTPASRGGSGTRLFHVERHPGPPPEPGEVASRSIFGEVGKQLLKVVAFPIGQAVGRAANNFVLDWETKNQGYGIRDFSPSVFRATPTYFDSDALRWEKLAKGRTLLFIHGTFSRAHGAFGAFPVDRMAQLRELYEDRIIAFDHLSLSRSPIENIEWLIDAIPEGRSLDVDVVCHSRGGLVARALAEWPGDLPGNRRVKVHRLALVGATNNGTILADVTHWNDLVNVISTVLNAVGVVVGEMVDLVLSFVRQIAVAAYPEIRGLSAMVPGGDYLKNFNGRPRGTCEYLAIGSNYEPTDTKLKSYFNDVIKDAIFGKHENDAMVRQDSICGSDVPGEFRTVTNTLWLPASQGIEHSYYFGHPDVAAKLVEFFRPGIPGPA
jgi:pimeloyl-ACP methyl ester carboxylesterase